MTEVKKVVIKKVTYILAHTPDLVRYGSKPERELKMDDELLPLMEKHLRSFEDAVAYSPNQVFIGNLTPLLEPEIKKEIPPDIYEKNLEMMAMVIDPEELEEKLKVYRSGESK